MANVVVKLIFASSDKGPVDDETGEAEHLPVPPGAISVRIQEKQATIGQDDKGNDTILYTWKDVGKHRAAQSGTQTELSKKQRLIVEIEGDV